MQGEAANHIPLEGRAFVFLQLLDHRPLRRYVYARPGVGAPLRLDLFRILHQNILIHLHAIRRTVLAGHAVGFEQLLHGPALHPAPFLLGLGFGFAQQFLTGRCHDFGVGVYVCLPVNKVHDDPLSVP